MADDILIYLMNDSEISNVESNQQFVAPLSEACPACSTITYFQA